jgi:hypothetical protein
MARLGTVAKPGPKIHLNPFSPELRLSHYLSQILLPQVLKGNSEILQIFRKAGKGR